MSTQSIVSIKRNTVVILLAGGFPNLNQAMQARLQSRYRTFYGFLNQVAQKQRGLHAYARRSVYWES